jgi:hypothetical protein
MGMMATWQPWAAPSAVPGAESSVQPSSSMLRTARSPHSPPASQAYTRRRCQAAVPGTSTSAMRQWPAATTTRQRSTPWCRRRRLPRTAHAAGCFRTTAPRPPQRSWVQQGACQLRMQEGSYSMGRPAGQPPGAAGGIQTLARQVSAAPPWQAQRPGARPALPVVVQAPSHRTHGTHSMRGRPPAACARAGWPLLLACLAALQALRPLCPLPAALMPPPPLQPAQWGAAARSVQRPLAARARHHA